jgi:hypothetical protein
MVDGVDAALNSAYMLASAKTETGHRFADDELDVTDATTAIDLPADCRRVNAVVLKSTGRPLTKTRRDIEAMDYGHPDGELRQRGTPRTWEQIGAHLYVFPYPDSDDTLIIEYLQAVTPLADDGDEPNLYEEYHYGIVEDAVEQLAAALPIPEPVLKLAKARRDEWNVELLFMHRGRSQAMQSIHSVHQQRQPIPVSQWTKSNT